MDSGGAAATGAIMSGDSARMSDTASATAAESRRKAFVRFGLEQTSRCRNPTSPHYDDAVHRGEELPAGWVMTRFRFTGRSTVPLPVRC